MLAELYIQNFAIIEELRINFSPGLNTLTGETGAGKSIILDAMALVLGDRADTTMVRDGTEEAYVEAYFRLSELSRQIFQPILEREGLEGDDEEYLVLARQLRANGRNVCRVNGRSVNLSLLREIGDSLVDIHGQGEHLSLLKPQAHLPLLDAFAGLVAERRQFSARVAELQSVRRELQSLRDNERALAQRIDLLRFQIEEISAAALVPGEEEELRGERTRLANAEQLLEKCNAAMALINGYDGEMPAASDLLSEAEREVAQLARLDAEMSAVLERLEGLNFQISEIAAELQAYEETLEFNPQRLEFVEERLELLNRLKTKYGSDIEAVLQYSQKAATELEQNEYSQDRIDELVKQEESLLYIIGELGAELSGKRQEAAANMARQVEKELQDLHMDRSRFDVSFGRTQDEKGAYVGEERFAFDSTGIDQIQFIVSANPGEPLKPLVKVASGGETSRLMLALKTVLARADTTPTLIFDEIDQGIGGRVGDVVGKKLWGLTAAAAHQVIVVTHLPQLAGYADGHFHVSKLEARGRTTTQVDPLDRAGRVNELAAMLGTSGEYARGGAEEILKHTDTVKSANTTAA